MTSYNLVFVLNVEKTKILMCYRSKEPYIGKFNLLGGKIDEGEDGLESAYRELFEESGITKKDITLIPFIDFTWHPFNMDMKVYIGKLNHKVVLVKEIDELHWLDITEDFYDMSKFAGEGNLGHMIEIYKLKKEMVD